MNKQAKIQTILSIFLLIGFVISYVLPITAETVHQVQPNEESNYILRAMKDELHRSMNSLVIEGSEKPYYMEYTILEQREWKIQAGFGALTRSDVDRKRYLQAKVKVGDYASDNSGYVSSRLIYSFSWTFPNVVVKDENYNALRRQIWLLTDRAYKDAVEQLAAKKAFLKNQVESQDIADFSQESPVQNQIKGKEFAVNLENWEIRVKKFSRIFREFPSVQESKVNLLIKQNLRYYTNSEGTVTSRPDILISLVVNASSRTEDGMELKHHIPFYCSSLDTFADDKTIEAGIRKMAQELTALTQAPVMEEYIGPVLFTGQASAELITQIMVPHLSGIRPPLCDNRETAEMLFSSQLTRHLHRRVLPTFLSLRDDPQETVFQGEPLLGNYVVDDEGVTAKPLLLVDKGRLTHFLMNRRPTRQFAHSNGRGRAGMIGNPGAHISNLFVQTEQGKSYDQLKKELLALCASQQIPYGIIIKTIDNPAITGRDLENFSFLNAAQSISQLASPVMIYRIFTENGREELVRGTEVNNMGVKDLKYILSAGNDYYIYHRLLAPGIGLMGQLYYRHDSGWGIPTSIIVPSLLFEEVEFKPSTQKRENPPLLNHPFFQTKSKKK